MMARRRLASDGTGAEAGGSAATMICKAKEQILLFDSQTILICKAKRQYLLTCKVKSDCLFAKLCKAFQKITQYCLI